MVHMETKRVNIEVIMLRGCPHTSSLAMYKSWPFLLCCLCMINKVVQVVYSTV